MMKRQGSPGMMKRRSLRRMEMRRMQEVKTMLKTGKEQLTSTPRVVQDEGVGGETAADTECDPKEDSEENGGEEEKEKKENEAGGDDKN